MSQIGIESIKELRTLTGAGIMDCRRALEEVGGQIDRAVELLREKGIAKAGNKTRLNNNVPKLICFIIFLLFSCRLSVQYF